MENDDQVLINDDIPIEGHRSCSEKDERRFVPPPQCSSAGRMNDLPDVDEETLSRQFELDDINIMATSMDVTNHGCYIVVGCSNGMVVLFNMAGPSRAGVLVGHIKAKGLHTNLLLTVKISEDSRFIFAGVMKGSMEMLAIDIGKLPVWPAKSKASKILGDLVTRHSHSDPKLRGLGAVVRVFDSSNNFQYRLVCGKGIKNIHIWLFFPDSVGGPTWTCLYDVASNGNTIETVGFRKGGQEVLSKSSGMCARLWNLHGCEEDPTAKLGYEDIPNTQDTRLLLDEFAFGGTYNFALVKIGAPKLTNRDAFEVPERSVEDDNGQRRKRMMRLIDDIVATQDGKHALALCTDGGVLYFRNDFMEYLNEHDSPSVDQYKFDSTTYCSLIEFNALRRESEGPWALKRVGSKGSVILLRAVTVPTVAPLALGHMRTIISVNLLTDETNGEVTTTKVPKEVKPWNSCGYYYDDVAEGEECVTFEKTVDVKPLAKKKSLMTPKASINALITPAVANAANGLSNGRSINISPDENLMQIVDSSVSTPVVHRELRDGRKRRASAMELPDSVHETRTSSCQLRNLSTYVETNETTREVKTFKLEAAPKVLRVVESSLVLPPVSNFL